MIQINHERTDNELDLLSAQHRRMLVCEPSPLPCLAAQLVLTGLTIRRTAASRRLIVAGA